MKKNETAQQQKRVHIYEIDLIRAITVFTVVAIHTLAYTNTLVTGKLAFQWLNILGHMLHYNREMFVFVTGLVLTFVYFNKPFSVKKFWLKRFTLVLIPYILWSVFYVVYNNSNDTLLQYIQLSAWGVLTGDASFQLYYILLTLQFYALFPLFLLLLRKVAQYPWRTLAVSFVIQILLIFFDFHYLQVTISHPSHLQQLLVQFQDRIFLLYQFFFVLGAVAAVYLNTLQQFFRKHGKHFILVFFVSAGLYILYSYYQLFVWKESLMYATSVLQPSVVLYSIAVIAFFSFLAVIWEKRRHGYKFIKVIAETSFGIYFVHVLALSLITELLLPIIPTAVPVLIKILTVLLLAFSASVVFCWVLLKIPWLSWTIGKGQGVRAPLKKFSFFTPTRYALGMLLLFCVIIIGGSTVIVYGIRGYEQDKKLTHTSKSNEAKKSEHAFSLQNAPASESATKVLDRPISSAGCGKLLTLKPGNGTTIGITSGGLHRLYRIYLPRFYVNTVEHPLVISFHGYGSDAVKQEKLTGFDPIANKNNIIVAYPQGTPDADGLLGWNTGLHKDIRANDVLFVSNMLNQIQNNLCVNPQQIYATGFSNGGGFVNMLALRFSNRIAAFAPVSGSYVSSFARKLARAVPIIEFHGTGDTTVPYNGDPRQKEFSVNTWIDKWVRKDNCQTHPQTIYKTNKIVGYEWSGCRNDASIVHYELIGEKHIWPVSLFKQDDNNKTKYITASLLIWQFFEEHPLNTTPKVIANNLPLAPSL